MRPAAYRHYNLAPRGFPDTQCPTTLLCPRLVKTALDAYVDPYLGETLGAAQAVRAVECARRAGRRRRLHLGFPVGGYRG